MTSAQLAALIQRLTAERSAAGHAADWHGVAALDRQIRQFRLLLLKVRQEELQAYPLMLAQRRQAKRCLGCGVAVSRFVLCEQCRVTWSFCPTCQQLYKRRAGSTRRASAYCTSCASDIARSRHGNETRAAYLEGVRERRRQLLPEVIRLYQQGADMGDIACAMSLTPKQLDKLIQTARLHGEWPAGLRRRTKKGL